MKVKDLVSTLLLLGLLVLVGRWLGWLLPGQSTTAPAQQVPAVAATAAPVQVVVILPTPAPAVEQAQKFQSAPAADASVTDGSQDRTAASSGDAGVDSGVTVLGGQNQITVNNAAGTSAEAADTSGAAAAHAEVANTAGQTAVVASPASGISINSFLWGQDVIQMAAVGATVEYVQNGQRTTATTDPVGRINVVVDTGSWLQVCWAGPQGRIWTWRGFVNNSWPESLQLDGRRDLSECPPYKPAEK